MNQKQYELGLAAYEADDMDVAIKWLAAPEDNRTPVFIPEGGGDVRIEIRGPD